jgi:hypothetical protein
MGSRNNKPGRIVKGTAKQPTLKDASGVWTLDEAMQAHRANAWPQPNLLQPISKSLRIKQQSSSLAGYLTRPAVKDGDRYRFTLSMWVKLGTLTAPSGSIRTLFEGFTGTDNSYLLIYISSGNNFYIGRDDNGSPSGSTVTWAGVLRDPTAWQHIVLTYDTLQSTDANKVKFYLNGIQQTLGGTFPAQSYPTTMGAVRDRNNNSISNNYGAGFRIGSRWNTTYDQNFDGKYSEINFIDGHALDVGLFGQTGTDGVWIPKEYTGSRGTNGFYLPFTNNTSSQTLGFDYSNFSTYDADKDPHRGSVSLHLTGNGPAGNQNNTFADSSSNNYTITRNGTATQGSASPFAHDASVPYNPATHGASAYFNGTSDSLQVGSTNGPLLPLNTAGAYMTVEAWVYPTSLRAGGLTNGGGSYTHPAILALGSTYFNFGVENGTPKLYWWTGVGNGLSSSITIPVNAWSHLALVFNGSGSNNLKLYVNGVLGATGTFTNISWASASGGNTLYIGQEGAGAGTSCWPGYISNLRIVNAAIYTSAFKPPRRPLGLGTTNLCPASEDSSQWSATGVTLYPNAAVSPDGTPTAVKIYALNGGGTFAFASIPGSQPSGTITFSAYLKAGEITTGSLFLTQGGNNGAVFDLVAGTVSSVTGTGNTAAITSVGNGWFRCSVTNTGGTTASGYRIGASNGALTTYSYNGSIYAWGAQVETTASVTAYTPTPENYSSAPTLLMNFANAAIVDTVGTCNLVTISSTTITSASKYGNGAILLNGSSYATIPGTSAATYFGTADFTIELWWKSNGSQSSYAPIISQGFTGSPPAGTWGLKVAGSSQNLQFTYNSSLINVGQNIISTINPNDSNWHHIAVCRNLSKIYMFIDGIPVGNYSITASDVVGNISSDILIGYQSRDSSYANGYVDDLRITKGVARYVDSFTPPNRALPEIGGKSFVAQNINTGVVKTFTVAGPNIVSAKIYSTYNGLRSANYTVDYSDDNSNWTTAFSGVMSNNSSYGLQTGTVTSGGSGNAGTGLWGPHLYWRYVVGAAVVSHHPRTSRLILTDFYGNNYNAKLYTGDNTADAGEYLLGTVTWTATVPTRLTKWTAPTDVTQVEVLVVAGGGAGGGGSNGAGMGGGGAGGLVYNSAYPVIPGQTYNITVGAGGAGVTSDVVGPAGSNSSFGSLTAIGGGGGGGNGTNGAVGGSGGGASYNTSAAAGTSGQGFAGGAGNGTSPYPGGGGGGAGAAGSAGSGSTAGNGGIGLQFGISGTPSYYAGGGGGGLRSGTAGVGGLGGGGTGAANSDSATGQTHGTEHTGGGGGGAAQASQTVAGGNGGSGVVILRYTTATEASSATDDNTVDSPTNYGHDMGLGGEVVGNYATANPLDTRATALTYRNGNLTLVGATSNGHTRSTIGVRSGKWYWEITCLAFSPNFHHGASAGQQQALTGADYLGAYSNEWGYWPNTSGTNTAYWRNSGSTVYTDLPRALLNDTLMFALDIDNGKIYAGLNGTWFKSGNPVAGTNALSTNIPTDGTYVFPHFMQYDSTGVDLNFGQRPWKFQPPTGFNALTTKNLPIPTGAGLNPNQHFDAVLWTGNGTSQTISSLNFQPDLIWLKGRNNASWGHFLQDSVRGVTEFLKSNTTEIAGTTSPNLVNTITSTGFTVLANGNSNNNNDTYVAWCWKAGNGTTTNTSGAITSTVSVNSAAGFSIVSYTGTGSNSTTGHGLSAAPNFIMWKARDDAYNWDIYHSSLGYTSTLIFTTAATRNVLHAAPTSTTIPVTNTYTGGSANGKRMIAYCWTEVAGFSRFSTYTGNGSTDGPFVNCGFKPKFVLIKAYSGTSAASANWLIFDSTRSTYNPTDAKLAPNLTDAENSASIGGTSVNSIDFLLNGFKLRTTYGSTNESGTLYAFVAFAEAPTKYARAR